MKKLAETTGTSIIFGDDLVEDIFVSGKFRETSISYILDTILKQHSIFYTISDNVQITIHKQRYPGLKKSIIIGRVLDEKSGKPIEAVNVYIADSFLGAATNEDGYYSILNIPEGNHRVIFSMIGYKKQAKTIRFHEPLVGELHAVLEEDQASIDEIVVEGVSRKEWNRYFKQFTATLLGTTKNARKTWIVNPEILDFEYNDAQGVLLVSAKDVLVIENRALGYRLNFLPEDLLKISNNLLYQGLSHFELLVPKNRKEKKQWERNRKETYEGSLRHFLASLANNNLTSDKFRVYNTRYFHGGVRENKLIAKDYAGARPSDIPPSRSATNEYIFPAELSSERTLRFDDYLEIRYKASTKTSAIKLSGVKSTVIRTNGYRYDPYALIIKGEWSKSGLADLLPSDYDPEGGEQQDISMLNDDLGPAREENSALYDFYEEGKKKHNEGNFSDALKIWLSGYKFMLENDMADPKIGIAVIRFATENKLEHLYDIASDIYLWGFSKYYASEDYLTIKKELARIYPLLSEKRQLEWETLLENGSQSLFPKIREFWITKDPIASTKVNERLMEHWQRQADAREKYTNTESTIYRTDERGEIFVKYGSPDVTINDTLGTLINAVEPFLLKSEIKYHELNHMPEIELWIYNDVAGKENMLYLFGKNGGSGDYGLRGSLEEFIPGDAFLEKGKLSHHSSRLGYLLQELYYKQMEDVDEFFYRKYLDLTTASNKNNSGENVISRFSNLEAGKNDPVKRNAPPAKSYFTDMSQIQLEHFPIRMLNEENEPMLSILMYSVPFDSVTANPDIVFNFNAANKKYELIHSLIIRDEKWNEIHRQKDVPSQRNSIVSAFYVPHYDGKESYLVASDAGDFPLRSSGFLSENDSLFGQLASKNIVLDNSPPLETDKSTLVLSDLLIGTSVSSELKKYLHPFTVIPKRNFTNDELLHIHLEIYNLTLGSENTSEYSVRYLIQKLEKRTLIDKLTRNVKTTVFSSQSNTYTSTASRTIESTSLEISNLAPGQYELTVFIEDKFSEQKKNRNLLFEIKEN